MTMNVREPPDRGRGLNIKQSKTQTINESNKDQKKPQITNKGLNNKLDINDNHNFRYKINEAEKQLQHFEHLSSTSTHGKVLCKYTMYIRVPTKLCKFV